MAQHDASLKSYLREIARYPLLTPEQEICYGRQIKAMQAAVAEDGAMTRERQRVIRIGTLAKRKFMCSNLKLVVSVAKKYSTDQRKSLELMDLVQEGNIGLARAVELFDPARGYRFTTYAYWWIRQSIHRAIAQMDTLVRMPVSLHDKVIKVHRVGHELSHKLGRYPTSEELAKELDISVDALLMGIRQSQHQPSLDQSIKGNDTGSIIDIVPDENGVDTYEVFDHTRARNRAVLAFENMLDPMTKAVIARRIDETPVPWKEMHRQTKLTVTRLRQIEQEGLAKLRRVLRDERLV